MRFQYVPQITTFIKPRKFLTKIWEYISIDKKICLFIPTICMQILVKIIYEYFSKLGNLIYKAETGNDSC